MLQVEAYERIRRAVVVQGKRQREAARELGHSRKTIAKALKHSTPPGYRRQAPVRRPVLGGFEAIIDAWVAEDRHRRPSSAIPARGSIGACATSTASRGR